MNKQELIDKAKQIEQDSFFFQGRDIDGAIYTVINEPTYTFIKQAMIFFGGGNWRKGREVIKNKIKTRKDDGEILANPECSNWLLWTILNKLEVSRIKR